MKCHKMKYAAALLCVASVNADASLTGFTGAHGAGLVYSSVSNVTWTQDANLLGTLETTMGYTNAITAIIAASPTITDTPNVYDTPANSGLHNVSAADFLDTNSGWTGMANWFGAKAFVGYLNSINYGGSTQWRLPTSNSVFGLDGTAGNELGQLYYGELGGAGVPPLHTAAYHTAGFNVQAPFMYSTGTEYSADPNVAWYFDFFVGSQGIITYDKNVYLPAWAVSPGQVNAVPVPGAVWLFGTGLIGLLGFKRRVHAG